MKMTQRDKTYERGLVGIGAEYKFLTLIVETTLV